MRWLNTVRSGVPFVTAPRPLLDPTLSCCAQHRHTLHGSAPCRVLLHSESDSLVCEWTSEGQSAGLFSRSWSSELVPKSQNPTGLL
eukprot:352917-Chlamydomonas_euryale.AAC.11